MIFSSTFSPSAQEFMPSDASDFVHFKQIKEFKPFMPSGDASTISFTPFQPSNDSLGSPFIPSQYSQGFAATSFQPEMKGQLCNGVIQNGYCQYPEACMYAHSLEELPGFGLKPNDKFKT